MIKKICFGLGLFIGTYSTAFAEASISACHGNGGYPPYHFQDENAQMIGVSIDLTTQIFDRLPYDLKITALPWKRCYNNAKKGLGYHLIIDGSHKKEREEFFYYSTKIHTLNPAIVLRENSPFAQSDKVASGDLKGAILCSNRGTNLTPYGLGNDDISARASGVTQGLQMVASERCDGYLTLYQVFKGHYRNDPEQRLPQDLVARLIDTDATFDLHLMISKQTEDAKKLRDEINIVMEMLTKDGSINRLWQQYQ